jgi:hypothetical protein
MAAAGRTGTYDVVSPPGLLTFGELLRGAEVTWVDEAFLAEHEVEPWTELPLWLPSAEFPGVYAISGERARAAGLRARPAHETMDDTRAWLAQGATPSPYRSELRAPGLAPEREAELLRAWRARS